MSGRRCNPRGSTSMDAAAYYLVAGGACWALYNLALQGKMGTDAQKAAMDLKNAIKPTKGGTGSSASSSGGGSAQSHLGTPQNAPSSGVYAGLDNMKGKLVPLALKDFGGVPVAYNVDRDTIVQNVSGGAVYAPGDVFFDSAGTSYQYLGSGQIVAMDIGVNFSVRDFVAEG